MTLPFFIILIFPIWKEKRGFPETDNNYARKKDLLCHVWQLAELTKISFSFGDRYCVPESYSVARRQSRSNRRQLFFESISTRKFWKKYMAKNTAMTYNNGVVFVEAPIFSKRVYDYLNEDEYVGLQLTLVIRPEAAVLERSGGLQRGRVNEVARESFIISKKKSVKYGC